MVGAGAEAVSWSLDTAARTGAAVVVAGAGAGFGAGVAGGETGVTAATGGAGAECARGLTTGVTCRATGRLVTARRLGALKVLCGFTAPGRETRTWVVAGLVPVGSGPRLAS